jgi:hypothetical protein
MADFTGRWRVVSSPDFDDGYMRMEVQPFIVLYQAGSDVEGEYHVGLQSGGLGGRVRKDGSLVFSFEGSDEMEEVHGAGTATVAGDRLTFTLDYHYGDEWTFECEREK